MFDRIETKVYALKIVSEKVSYFVRFMFTLSNLGDIISIVVEVVTHFDRLIGQEPTK